VPEQVTRVFRKVIPTGIQHGTVTVMLGTEAFEVTTLRGETTYSNGRHPDAVFFVDDLAADLARRDFTINAIAYDVDKECVVDPFGGVEDLRAGLIRAVGSANERFAEDGLRVLRGARFCATLEFALEPSTRDAITPNLPTFARVSVERIREEWLKCMKARAPSLGFRVMLETGILRSIYAPLEQALRAQPEPPEAFVVLDGLAKSDPLLRLLGLFTALQSAEWDTLMRKLKFSNDERKRAMTIAQSLSRARELGLMDSGAVARDADIRRWLQTVMPHGLSDWHQMAAALASTSEQRAVVDALAARAKSILARGDALTLAQLAVDGAALQAELGLPPSKALGTILHALLQQVIDDPTLNQRDRLLAIARAHPAN
jgi:tRNA nucleotidyltransferase (CCA-adding enzyme)